MDMTEKSGQPSMEEILASIRRIIAEEPADSISLDFKPRSGSGAQHLDLDDASDFELPSMFRASASSTNGSERTSTSGKLMDALRATPQFETSTSLRTEAEFPLPANFSEPIAMASTAERAPLRSNTPATSMTGLSSLRPTARAEPPASELFGRNSHTFAMPSVEAVSTEQLTSTSWAVEAPALEITAIEPTPVESSAPVVRQMVPFKDQHFTRMCNLAPTPQAPIISHPEPEVFAVQRAPQPPSFATLAFNSATPPPLTNVSDTTGMPTSPPSLSGALRAAEASFAPQANSAPSTSAGQIEDATAELLRPMLRQWLSENMPRMVEKALHIEVAESVRPGKKPGSV